MTFQVNLAKVVYFDLNFTVVGSYGSYVQYVSTGLDNGYALLTFNEILF